MDSFRAWTDRSLLLLEWHPTKPYSTTNFFSSVGKLSASAVKITIVLFLLADGLVQVLWFPDFTLPFKGTHIVVEGATLTRRRVEEINVCTCFSHRL